MSVVSKLDFSCARSQSQQCFSSNYCLTINRPLFRWLELCFAHCISRSPNICSKISNSANFGWTSSQSMLHWKLNQMNRKLVWVRKTSSVGESFCYFSCKFSTRCWLLIYQQNIQNWQHTKAEMQHERWCSVGYTMYTVYSNECQLTTQINAPNKGPFLDHLSRNH